jgi:hypothetical protein
LKREFLDYIKLESDLKWTRKIFTYIIH